MNKHKSLLKENQGDVCELEMPMAGLISEEEVPSLYSLSLSDSMCSSSTVDLEVLEQSETYPKCDHAHPFHSSPLENNFMEEEKLDNTKMSTLEASIDMSNSLNNTSRNCISLHDVSNLTPLQLPANSTNTVSCETIHSQSLSSTTKSKDSGFQRSVSCLSLSSGKRNYDHIESKVKAYIRNIKESEALRKQQLLAEKAVVVSEPASIVEFDSCLGKEDLVQKVQDLTVELHEKALFIDTQQKNYNSLLLKLAEAKNTIDALRVQRISLNYSSANDESRNIRAGDIDLGVFEHEISRQQNKLSHSFSWSCGSNVNKKKSLEPSSNSFITSFKPKINSTPQNKDANKHLSPVSKIFSSSSRLDKGFRPLASLKKEKSFGVSLFHDSNRSNVQSYRHGKKVSNFSTENVKSKLNKISNGRQKSTLLCNKKHVTTNIDLPNVDPFDKVKKWQASLPSINLLGTQSSSDCEDSLQVSSRKRNLRNHSENEIDGTLSLELMAKLKISEEPLKSSSCTNIAMCKKKTMSRNLNNFSAKNTNTNVESKKDQIRSQNEFEKALCAANTKSIECPDSNFRGLTEPPLTSTSQIESQTNLPKSSSWAYTFERQLKSDSSNSTDDSSSVSSSSSRESRSLTSSNKSNLKFSLRKSKTEVTLPKPFRSSTASTKIVLQKPKLNYKPMKNISNFSTNMVVQKEAQSLNNCSSNLKNLKVESSQRKAWNERNTTNFNVCKEFCLKRSSSLQECLNIMKNMVDEGSSIIETTLERSHCH